MLVTRRVKFLFTSAIIIFVGSLLCAVVTVAWFAANRKVGGNGAQITIEAPLGIGLNEFQIYKRDGKLDEAALYYNSEDHVGDTEEQRFTFEMTEYDTIFLDRNVNTPVIFRVVLEDVLVTEGDDLPEITCTIVNSTTTINGTDGLMSTDLANIIYITCAPIISYQFDGDSEETELNNLDKVNDANKIFEAVKNTFNSSDYDKSTFVDKTSKDSRGYYNSKTDSITYTFQNYETINNSLIIYIEINYDNELINNFILQHALNPEDDTEISGDTIKFANNITKIIFSYKKGGNNE